MDCEWSLEHQAFWEHVSLAFLVESQQVSMDIALLDSEQPLSTLLLLYFGLLLFPILIG